MAKKFSADVIIFGAGIAGLWLHHRLNQKGYRSLLLEKKAIGNAQTLSSQGIIHGGTKYAINGILSKASQAIAEMPARWQSCLANQGDVDLSSVNTFTDHQLMWSKEQVSSKMMSFFASKALASRMTPLTAKQRPLLFQSPEFKGTLYQLDEPVLDIPSVLTQLAAPYRQSILKLPDSASLSWRWHDDKTIESVDIDGAKLEAQHFVFTAGEGTGALLQSLKIPHPSMQLRPLQMLLAKSAESNRPLPQLYAHSLGSGAKPAATITSHFDSEGDIIWYIGGNIAEDGVGKSPMRLIEEAQRLLKTIMPWVSLPKLNWATHIVNRAEPKQSMLTRPDSAFVHSETNLHIAWPTKLALAPDLADQTLTAIEKRGITTQDHSADMPFSQAEFGPTLWDSAFQ